MLNNLKFNMFLQVVFAFLIFISVVVKINAQESLQTYVALTGHNEKNNQPGQQSNLANDCKEKLMPCKTITYALTKTKDGGTVALLEGGEADDEAKCGKPYDSVIVDKSVIIEADANMANKPCFLSNLNFGFGIKTVGSAGKFAVKLRKLRFIGDGGYVGVEFVNGSKLIVEDCYFNSLNHGIVFDAEGSLIATGLKIHAGTDIKLDNSNKRKTAFIGKCLFFWRK